VTADLIRGDIYYWGSLMAGAVSRACRCRHLRLVLAYYVSGLTAGAVRAEQSDELLTTHLLRTARPSS